MLDIKLLRENPEKVKQNLQKRLEYDTTIVDEVIKLDEEWRKLKTEQDKLKSEKNKESKAIADIKKKGADIKSQLAKVKKISEQIDAKESESNVLLNERDTLLKTIPNLLDDDVIIGEDDEKNEPFKFHGKKPKYTFTPRSHQELCELNDWYDLETAAKHSGSRFYYMKNELVMLEMALYNFVLNKLISKGYSIMEVPPMLRKESAIRAIPLSDFDDTVYALDDNGQELFLIGTSEHTLAVIHADEILNHKDLPKRYAGVSPCFRREAGVTKDEKGIFRVHNFNKIEQFIYCKPEESDTFLQEILQNAEEIFQDLELHYQVINICSGDMGFFAAKKYDIEGWIPSQERYRELVSASNYRDFGARRMNSRYQTEKNTIEVLNTLNSTAIAMQRAIIAIIEQHQTEDGNVKIPQVLRPYFGNREFLKQN